MEEGRGALETKEEALEYEIRKSIDMAQELWSMKIRMASEWQNVVAVMDKKEMCWKDKIRKRISSTAGLQTQSKVESQGLALSSN